MKYDWRVPFTDDEADTDVELPRLLADTLQELTVAAAAAVTHAAAAERAAAPAAQGGIGSPGRPWLSSPATSAKGEGQQQCQQLCCEFGRPSGDGPGLVSRVHWVIGVQLTGTPKSPADCCKAPRG